MCFQCTCIGYSIPGHSIWKRMPWGETETHSFSYTNNPVLYNQFSPYFLCQVSWLPIITNLGSLSQIRLNEYQLKSISVNYNICGIWKIFNNTRQRKYGLNWLYNNWSLVYEKECIYFLNNLYNSIQFNSLLKITNNNTLSVFHLQIIW